MLKRLFSLHLDASDWIRLEQLSIIDSRNKSEIVRDLIRLHFANRINSPEAKRYRKYLAEIEQQAQAVT